MVLQITAAAVENALTWWQYGLIIFGAVAGLGTIVTTIKFWTLNKRKLNAETRKAENEADLTGIELLNQRINSMRQEYDKEIEELNKKITKLEDRNNDLERVYTLYRVAADNLGYWKEIEIEIERIKG